MESESERQFDEAMAHCEREEGRAALALIVLVIVFFVGIAIKLCFS